ncbi:hypothetical protein GCM10019016_044800 [Streptomyces prasinosporus]|uniref:Uncharacterized protein n=1 Tax=Streptomyces prasinosporus TaxID=68256 RepID=A0ABP6TRR0_9ACTN
MRDRLQDTSVRARRAVITHVTQQLTTGYNCVVTPSEAITRAPRLYMQARLRSPGTTRLCELQHSERDDGYTSYNAGRSTSTPRTPASTWGGSRRLTNYLQINYDDHCG